MGLEKGDKKEEREDDSMAMMIKPNEATIIKKGMLSSFLNDLHNSKTTKEFWNECEASRNAFSTSDIEQMKKMCNSGKQ